MKYMYSLTRRIIRSLGSAYHLLDSYVATFKITRNKSLMDAITAARNEKDTVSFEEYLKETSMSKFLNPDAED